MWLLYPVATYPAAEGPKSQKGVKAQGLVIGPPIIRKLNRILRRYPVHLSFTLPEYAPRLRLAGFWGTPDSGQPWFQLVPNRAAGELLFRLLWVAGSDLLWKVRRCEDCSEWLFARQDPQTRCKECHKEYVRHSDEWMARRARQKYEAMHPDEIPMSVAEAITWYLERKAARAAGHAVKTWKPKRKRRG